MRHQSSSGRPNLRAVRRTIPPPSKPVRPWLKVTLAVLAGVALLAYGVRLYVIRASAPLTVELTAGAVEHVVEVDAYVVRKETVYTAPIAGTARKLAEEGQRVRVGAPVVRIVPKASATTAPTTAPPAPTATMTAGGTQSDVRQQLDELDRQIYAKALASNMARDQGNGAEMDRLQGEMDQLSARQLELVRKLGREDAVPVVAQSQPSETTGREIVVDAAGVAVFQTDGLEAVLSPAKADSWTPTLLQGLAPAPRRTAETVAAGESVFKVVDNLSLSLLAVVPAKTVPQSTAAGEQRLLLRFEGREDLSARVSRRVPEGENVMLVLSAPVFPDELTHSRRVRTTLVFASYRGMIVPRTAIDVRDGLQGVWLVEGSRETFSPARVLGGNETHVALETSLPPGVRIRAQAPTRMR